MTIFVTRTRKAFWSIRPAPILLAAVLTTQLIATLLATYGILMAPIGWGWALFVWGYAFAWFLVNDGVKRAAYRVFDARERSLLGAIGIRPRDRRIR
jgi:H+-transporting ATPase